MVLNILKIINYLNSSKHCQNFKMKNSKTLKYILKELNKVTFPIPINITHITDHMKYRDTLIVEFKIASEICKMIKSTINCSIYFHFSPEYPLKLPIIEFINPTIFDTSPLYFNDDGTFNLCNYNICMTFSQLIMNCYCVLIEILNSENVIIGFN